MNLQRRTRQRQACALTKINAHWLWIVLIGSLFMLASCNVPGQAAQKTSPPQKHATPKPKSAPDSTAVVPDANANHDLAHLHQLEGPDGWTWYTSLPNNRLVVYYENPYSEAMGPLGQYSDDELIAQLQAEAQVYTGLDPTHPVVPAFDYVTPVVQPVPMKDNSWVYRMPDDSIQHYLTLANSNHMLFFFDMQIGHSTIQKEVNILWPYLKLFYKLDKPLLSPAQVLGLDPSPLMVMYQ